MIFDIQSMPNLDHPFHVLNFFFNCTSLKSLLVCGAILAETIRVLNDSLYIIEMYLGTIESSKEVDQRSVCTNRSNRRQECKKLVTAEHKMLSIMSIQNRLRFEVKCEVTLLLMVKKISSLPKRRQIYFHVSVIEKRYLFSSRST